MKKKMISLIMAAAMTLSMGVTVFAEEKEGKAAEDIKVAGVVFQEDQFIKQYDEMMNKDWETASEEQRCRIEQIRAQTERISSVTQSEDEDGVIIINDM